jgi:hypothetical protein
MTFEVRYPCEVRGKFVSAPVFEFIGFIALLELIHQREKEPISRKADGLFS